MNRQLNLLLPLLAIPAVSIWAQPAPGVGPGASSMEETATTPASNTTPSNFGNGDSIELIFPEETSDTGSASFGSDETISVDFPDEEIRTILRNVADLYDLNLVIPDTLQGNTSIKLRNVTWDEVFDVILEPIGFTYVVDRSIIKIRSQEDLAMEPMDTRVFLINYANAADMQESVGILVDTAAGGQVQVDNRTNALVITERPSRMNRIQEIIERLDRPTEQVMIESKFIEVTNRDVENIGVNWTSLSGYELSTGPYNDTRNRTRSDTQDTTVPAPPTPPDILRKLTEFSNVDSTVLSAGAFNMTLSALETLDDVKLVSNPTVVTLNNTEALIAIGERFPVPQYTYNDERGTYEVSGFDYEDIGITLNVTPQVNTAGFINLDIRPEVSTRQGTVIFGGASGAEIPIIGSRRTESNITIKDGFTLAIGGLVENQIQNGVNKVPVLGDIPGLGNLFKSRTDNIEQRNLIIFITARTLNPDGSTYEEVIDPRILAEMGVTERDVPGYVTPADEQEMIRAVRERRLQFLETDAREELADLLEAIQEGNLETRTNMTLETF